MATRTSTVNGKSNGSEQTSVHSEEVVSRRRLNIQMMQNVLLIWLDSNIDESTADCRNTITQLRHVINTVNMFTNSDECIEFLRTIGNEKACMIISGSLGQYIVPQVHNMSQVDSIFIFCGNKKHHKQWAKGWPKIKGVLTEIAPICEALKIAAQQCEQNSMSISFVTTRGDMSQKNLNQLEPSFMYTQILKEILLAIPFEQKHIDEFIQYCRDAFAENTNELKNVEKFEGQYHDRAPIWWYTYPCFLYPMLNRALRVLDADMIVKMGFFISDLHRHIEQLHRKQFGDHHSSKSFIVYRGQCLSMVDFEQMSKTKNGLISFNNFLSTSKSRDISLNFAQGAIMNVQMVGVLFVMTIDPTQSNTPFASITDVSYFGGGEGEVLFSMHTVFRIDEIIPMDGNGRLFQVKLTLTSDNDKDLRVLTDRIREETYPNDKGWLRLGAVLMKIGESEKAQQVYEVLLELTTDKFEKARIYDGLGWANYIQGKYEQTITFLEKSLKIRQKSLPPDHPDLATTYNNIGLAYHDMGHYPEAFSSHTKALEIRQKVLPPKHPDLAATYNNLAMVYYSLGDYSNALLSHEKGLAIKQQSLPANHPDLATSYNNIALVHDSMGDYPKALSSYEKALVIKQQSLLPNHPDLATSYNNIGTVYESMGGYPKALSSYEKALANEQQSLPPNHPDLASSYSNIGNVYHSMGDYPKALSSYEKALAIQQQSLPPNHPNLAASYNNIGTVYHRMGDYSKALSSYEKALAIRQRSLPPNHPDLASSYNNIGNVYHSMGDHSKALSSYEKAFAIQQQSLPPNHPDLSSSYSNIGLMYENMNNYSKAHSFYELAVSIGQQSLPSNHPHLQTYKKNLERVKKRL